MAETTRDNGTLRERLQALLANRPTSINELGAQLAAAKNELGQQLAAAREEAGPAFTELREALSERVIAVYDDVRDWLTDIGEELQAAIAEAREDADEAPAPAPAAGYTVADAAAALRRDADRHTADHTTKLAQLNPEGRLAVHGERGRIVSIEADQLRLAAALIEDLAEQAAA